MLLTEVMIVSLLAAMSPPQGKLLVRVLDPTGASLPGATVSLGAAGDCSHTRGPNAVTDSKGEVTLSVPTPQEYEIRFALKPFLGGTVGPVELSPGASFTVTVRMYGTLVDSVDRITGAEPLLTKTPR